MKFSHLTISLVISQESTSGEEVNKIRWIIEVNDLDKLHKGNIMFENQYSIVSSSL